MFKTTMNKKDRYIFIIYALQVQQLRLHLGYEILTNIVRAVKTRR